MYGKRRSNKVWLALLSGVSAQIIAFSTQAQATLFDPSLFSHYVVALNVGPSWTDAGDNQTFYLQPDVQKAYIAGNNSNTFVNSEAFLGVWSPINNWLQAQLGLAVAQTTYASFTGDIWEDADPEFNNFYYEYQAQHTRVALKGKLVADNGFLIQPWLSASIGAGFNRANTFVITPKIFEEIPAPPFSDRSTTSFSYTVGIGVQKAMGEHWQASLGYEFADWGKSQLGRVQGQTLNNGLQINHVYTNGLMLGLSCTA